ncbi:MAG TPA: nucleotidyltransferase family protein [Solirubrobacteraceae bacterium]|nr:nucleotidyltransferase family protein [Solirubrobacteraceae bacterium]
MRADRASPFRALCGAVARACGVPGAPAQPGAGDWDELARLAARHNVVGLLRRSGVVAAAPGAVRTALAAREQRTAMHALYLLAVQRRVLAALEEAGIRAIVLKGAALSAEAHGDPTARDPRDVDLLVAQRDVRPAIETLLARGLEWHGWRRPDDPDRGAPGPAALDELDRLPLLRDVKLVSGPLHVEVHWRLFENRRLMAVDPAWLAAPRLVSIQGGEVPTLPLQAHLAYVLVHGTNHLWSLMKWLADVPALVVRHPALARPEALAAFDNDRAIAAGLLVAEAAFGPFLPDDARTWARGVRGTRVLVRASLAALSAPDDRPKVVGPRELPTEVARRLAIRGDAAHRREELRLLLLTAGRAHAVPDPGAAELATAPLRWARRLVRRRLST